MHSDSKAAGEVFKMLQELRSSWEVAVWAMLHPERPQVRPLVVEWNATRAERGFYSMSQGLMTDAWEKLEALSNGMGRLEHLLEADRWEEVGEELRGQEKLTKEFTMWLGHRLQGSVEAGEMARRCCEELKGQMELVEELREATSRRKAELLEAMGNLNKQDQAAKEYERFRPGLGVTARAESKPNVPGGVGRRKELRSGEWDQRRLALYGLKRV